MRGGEYSSTSTLLQEISSLRARLKDLEDDTKSSVVSSSVVDDKESPLVAMLRKDVATLEQEKANQEKEFMNQIASLQKEHQRRMNDLHAKLRESESLNDVLNEKLKKSSMEAGELKEMLNRSVSDEAEYFKGRLTEAQAEIEELSSKVNKAVRDGEASRNKTETEDKYMRLLEEQRETHIREIEQMKENLASADMEITDCRGEIDALQEEIFELQQYRETLLQEVTTARVDYSDEKRVTQSLKTDISQLKLSIEKLQHEVKEKDLCLDQKCEEVARLEKNYTASPNVKKLQHEIDTKSETILRLEKDLKEKNQTIRDLEGREKILLSEITELKLQAEKKPAVGTPLTVDTSLAPGAADDNPITPAEKQQLVKDVQTLEERLVRFHSELADKDGKIDDLKTALAEEQKINKKLRAEIKTLKNDTSKSASLSENQGSGGSSSDLSVVASLRKQNQRLTEEVKSLRSSTDTKYGQSLSPQAIVVPPPALTRTASTRGFESPRTPVSGLVASFERRIGSQNFSNNSSPPLKQTEEATTVPPPKTAVHSVDEIAELQEKLHREKELVRELQQELHSHKETISNLQKKSGSISPKTLSNELMESRREIERLEAKLRDAEKSQSHRRHFAWKEREELDKLRTQSVYSNMQKDDYEKQIADLEREIALLRAEEAGAKNLSFCQNEKKLDAEAELDELVSLRSQLTKKEKALDRLRAKYEAYEDESEEALNRLRNQVEALQSELHSAMTEIERMEREAASGTPTSSRNHDAMKSSKVVYDIDMEKMELELTMTKARHAELESEHAAKVKTLEEKISALEQANLDLSTEVPTEAQKEFDEEAGKLTEELTRSQMKLADLELEYTIKIKRLEECIKSLTAELDEVKTENEKLQKALEAAASKSEANAEAQAKSQLEYDTETSRLSVELTKVQMEKADGERAHFERLKELEGEIEALEREAAIELDSKQVEVDMLKEKLKRKEDSIKRLEEEKTQLCDNMNDVSFSRKDEMQELQDEILDLTNKTKSQAREIQSLKMKIEEHEARKEEVNVKAQRRISELEEQVRDLQHVDRDAVIELKAENMQLRETIRDVKLERRSLKERLESITQGKSSSRSAQVLRDRNAALKQEVEKLTKRLKKMEDSITRFAI